MSATAWIYWLCGGSAALGGLAILAWALLRDRSRGRRRCPRCWYDMSGAPTLVCPECGRDARAEKRLFKTRRRWRGAVFGLVALAIGVGALAYPFFSGRGIYAFTPTEILILMAPDAGQERSGTTREKAVHEELLRRIDAHALTDWQWAMLLKSTAIVHHREKWPRGRPLLIDVTAPAWLEGAPQPPPKPVPQTGGTAWAMPVVELRGLFFPEEADQSDTPSLDRIVSLTEPPTTRRAPERIRLAATAVDKARLRLDVRVLLDTSASLWSGTLAEIPLVDDPAEAIPACAPEAARTIASEMRCMVWVRNLELLGRPPEVEIGVQVERLAPDLAAQVAIGVRAQLLRDGALFEECELLLTPGPLVCFHGPYPSGEVASCLAPLSGGAAAALNSLDPAERSRWSLRVIGDPLVAVDDLPKLTHWPGEREWPIAEVISVITPAAPAPQENAP